MGDEEDIKGPILYQSLQPAQSLDQLQLQSLPTSRTQLQQPKQINSTLKLKHSNPIKRHVDVKVEDVEPVKKMRKIVIISDDEVYDEKHLDLDSIDDIVQPYGNDQGRDVDQDENDLMIDREILEFLNVATVDELVENLSITYDQAMVIITGREEMLVDSENDKDKLNSYIDWVRFCKQNGLSRSLTKYREILNDLGSVDGIIHHCDMVSREIKRNMDYWKKCEDISGQTESKVYAEYLTIQPDVISKEFQLKKYQLIGISWMLMLYEKKLGGILADEMGVG